MSEETRAEALMTMFVNIYKSHEVNREAVACKVSRDR